MKRLFILIAFVLSCNSGSQEKDANACIEKGQNAYKKKEFQNAINYYNKAIELNPNNSHAYYNRGVAKSALLDNAGAKIDYNKAFELNTKDPADPFKYFKSGFAKHDLKDYIGAIADYTKAIALNPDYTDAYVKRGNAKCEIKNPRSAIADYNKAIKLNPADAYNQIKNHCN